MRSRILAFSIGFGIMIGIPVSANSQCRFDQEIFFSDAKANDAIGNAPDPKPNRSATATCGRGSSILRAYSLGSNRLQLPNGHTYLPLLLSDKFDGSFKCNRVKVRIACVVDVRQQGDRTLVQLAHYRDGSGNSGTLEVDTASGRVLNASSESSFALARYHRRLDQVQGSLPEHVRRRVDKFSLKASTCQNADTRRCREAKEFVAEDTILQALRIDRFPATVSAEAKRADRAELQSNFSKLAFPENAVHIGILQNEAPNISPYEIVDATTAASGPSFGAQQLDIGTTNEDARPTFREVASEILTEPSVPADISSAIRNRQFERSIRSYKTADLVRFYRAVPYLNASLRSQRGKSIYNDAHMRFLARSRSKIVEWAGQYPVFRESAFLGVYAIDVENQHGRNFGLPAQVDRWRRAGYSTDEVESKAIQLVLSESPYARHHPDHMRRRAETIKKTAAQLRPAGPTIYIRPLSGGTGAPVTD